MGASGLSRLVFNRLFARHNMVAGLVAVTLLSGPTPGRDETNGWAYSLRSYAVLQG